jgi:mono/diheme cytochrome c family protein
MRALVLVLVILRAAALVLALVGFLAAIAACGSDPAERSDEQSVARPGPGQVLYITYCQSCHGEAGHGDGPAAASLRTPPADLTRLGKRYGTPLDRKALQQYVDGRQLLSLHGGREMPIWGTEFFAEVPPGTLNLETVRHHLIEALVEYLETLQRDQRTRS